MVTRVINPSYSKPTGSSRSEQVAALGVVVLYVVQLMYHHPSLLGIVAALSLYLGLSYLSEHPPKISLGRWQLGVIFQNQLALRIGLILLFIPLTINYLAEPSHAVMLSQLQTFMTDTLFANAGVDGNAANYDSFVDFTINTLRAIYIFYLVAMAFQGFQQLRQNEGLSSAVQTALYSLVMVFAVDLVCLLVLPAAP